MSMAAFSQQLGPSSHDRPCAADVGFWRKWFWSFAAIHLIVWTLLPTCTQPNAPLDVIEITYWGHQWELGYAKHPPLPSWLCETAVLLTGGSFWGIYLLSQLSVVMCFWAVWRLALETIPPSRALLAVLLLECCAFYNLTTPEFNHAICMYASWALAILFFHWALQSGKRRYWTATGICLGLGMLTKYNTAALALPMLAWMTFHPKARRHWRTAGPYLTILAAAVLFAPHASWAVRERFVGITYLMNRTESDPGLLRQLMNPVSFLIGQAGILVPLAIAALPITGFPWRLRKWEAGQRDQRDFLLAMWLGPVLVCLAVSLLLAMKLRTAYGSQLWILSGLVMLYCLELQSDKDAWRRSAQRCLAIAAIMAVASVGRNMLGPYLQKKPSRVHFPGASLAESVERQWYERFRQPLPLAAGEWWFAGNVSCYGTDRASVYCGGYHPDSFDLIPSYSNWTNDADLNRRGGVILWDARVRGPELPEDLKKRFPLHLACPPIEVRWQTGAPLPPLEVGLAMIPPSDIKRGAGSGVQGARPADIPLPFTAPIITEQARSSTDRSVR